MPVNMYCKKTSHICRRPSLSITEISSIFRECTKKNVSFWSKTFPYNESQCIHFVKMKIYSFVLLRKCPFGNWSWISSRHILSAETLVPGEHKYGTKEVSLRWGARWRGVFRKRERRTLHYLTNSFTALAQADKCTGSQKATAKQSFRQSGSPAFGSRRTLSLRISWKCKILPFTEPFVFFSLRWNTNSYKLTLTLLF